MENIENVQWFPGHMTKTIRQIEKVLPLVDCVAEIIDARIPVSSRNPKLAGIVVNKPLIILLNKSDIADPRATKEWIAYFKNQGTIALPVNCKNGIGLSAFLPAINNILEVKIKRLKDKGMVGVPIRIMVAGIPNVGKSSFINRMANSSKAKVEDRPGVTRGNQWFKISKNVELLDTPGLLWPKFDDPIVGKHLAFTGAVKDTVIDITALSINLVKFLKNKYPASLTERYKITLSDELSNEEILKSIAIKRGMLISGGLPDVERTAIMLLDEFRGSKIGRISIEWPKQ